MRIGEIERVLADYNLRGVITPLFGSVDVIRVLFQFAPETKLKRFIALLDDIILELENGVVGLEIAPSARAVELSITDQNKRGVLGSALACVRNRICHM